MKFDHYLKRVEESREFKEFRGKHKKSYLSAGFFVLDLEAGKHMHQIDYFIPGSNKVATFIVDDGVKMQISEIKFKGKKPEKMDPSSKIDLEALEGIVHDEMMNKTVTQKVKKIIAVLVNQNGKKVWKLNCITGDMGIIKVNVDDSNSDVLEFEKASLFDIMKVIPKDGAQGTGQPTAPQPQAQVQQTQMPVQIKTVNLQQEAAPKKKEKVVKKGKK